MKLIVKMEFGSRVYGTNLPKSDRDYKFIYVPDPKDIILQKAKPNVQQNVKLSKTTKNTQDDVDCEGFSLQQYLNLLLDGQTMAVDMLFTPKEQVEDGELSWVWDVIRNNKERLLTKKVKAFVGYCRGQAVRYSVKGERLSAVEYVVNALEASLVHNKNGKLVDCLETHFVENPYPSLIKLTEVDNKGHSEVYLEVCGRKFQLNKTIHESWKQAKGIMAEYGQRSKNASLNNGSDNKALYHAVRIASEAEELLLTGKLTFPRPEKDLLLRIRNNELRYSEISDLLDDKLIAVENALEKSALQDEPDYKYAEELVFNIYLNQVRKL